MKNKYFNTDTLKDIIIASAVSIIVGIAYTAYIFTIGNRISQARNLYIEAQNLEESENEKKIELMKQSIEKWRYSEESNRYLEELEQK